MSWHLVKNTGCCCHKNGWNISQHLFKNIWFCCLKQNWKCPSILPNYWVFLPETKLENVSTKISSFVAWSTAGNAPTSRRKHLVLSSQKRLEMFQCLAKNIRFHYLKDRLRLSQNPNITCQQHPVCCHRHRVHQHESEEMMTEFVGWTVSLSCLF